MINIAKEVYFNMEKLFMAYGDVNAEVRELQETNFMLCSDIGCSTMGGLCCSTRGVRC